MTYLTRYFFPIIYTGVSKELELQMNYWKEKQQDIESQFKHLYRPMQSNNGQTVKGKKSKKVDHTNKELSYYAGSLTKEFLIKVRLIAYNFCSLINFRIYCKSQHTKKE